MNPVAVSVVRVVAAVVVFTGVVLLFTRDHYGPDKLVWFTVQSNLLVGCWFLWGAVRRQPPAVVGGAVTLYIFVTLLIFHLVLANPASGFGEGDQQFGSIQNILLHTVTPVLALLDWFLLRAERPRYGWALWWLVYPLVYLAFVLIRGAIDGQYPYPFLDVHANGYLGVSIISAVLFVVFWLLGLLLIWVARLRRTA